MGLNAQPDLFDPWREAPSALLQRTIGRDELLRRARSSIDDLVSGGRPLPLYLFGPSGVGKSHLAALLAAELRARGLPVRFVSADIAALRSADDLLRAPPSDASSWMGRARELDAEVLRAVWVVEGLDERLTELGPSPTERQRLRHVWSHEALWVLGTGRSLPAVLTAHSEPFYGFFDPEPIEALKSDEAGALFARVAESDAIPAARSLAITLAAGVPRLLLAFAVCCRTGDRSASEMLAEVVARFAPRSRQLFRSLPTMGQHIALQLARSPRAMTPGELARALDTSPQSLATIARRLSEDGVLARAEEGRSTLYALADPILRCWLEAGSTRWEETRIGMVCERLDAGAQAGSGHRAQLLEALETQLLEPHLHPELALLRDALAKAR